MSDRCAATLLRLAGRSLPVLAACTATLFASADGVVIDILYDPYVQPLETEFEWRGLAQLDDDAPDLRKYYFGVGRSLSDRWATEFYAIGARGRGESLSIDAYELEFKWQLTEQGEFAFDWGLLFELEREVEDNVWEVSTSLLTARDFGRWTATTNVDLIYEWGGGIDNEFETGFHGQARYRYKPAFEPAVELHVGQDTLAIGPAASGLLRISAGKKLRWSAGYFAGLDDESPDRAIRLHLEYEF